MIPQGPQDIGRYARVIEHIDNRRSLLRDLPRTQRLTYSAEKIEAYLRSHPRYREIHAGEIVRITNYRQGDVLFGDPTVDVGPGLAKVMVQPDGDPGRARETVAYNLELVETPTMRMHIHHPPLTVTARSDTHAQDLSHAHQKVADAYMTLAYALNDLKALEKRS